MKWNDEMYSYSVGRSDDDNENDDQWWILYCWYEILLIMKYIML